MVPAVDKPGMKRKKFEASSYQASSACLKITGSATLLGHTHRHTHTHSDSSSCFPQDISHMATWELCREMLSQLTLKKNLNVRLWRTSEGRDSQSPVLIGGVAFEFLFTKSRTFTLPCSHLLREVCICAAAHREIFVVTVYLFIFCPYVAGCLCAAIICLFVAVVCLCYQQLSLCSQ